jgi:hypothetical protein
MWTIGRNRANVYRKKKDPLAIRQECVDSQTEGMESYSIFVQSSVATSRRAAVTVYIWTEHFHVNVYMYCKWL